MRFGLFKTSPRVHLIKREGGVSELASLPAGERQAVLWLESLGSKPMSYVFWGHLVFMPVAYILILFWPPYHHAFVVTDWIANILPHRIFGILTVSQEQLDHAGATLPRAAYIHFIVEQIMLSLIYLLWMLANCRRYWRLYPHYEAYQRRQFVNYDEQQASIGWPTKLKFLVGVLSFLLVIVWLVASPDFLLMLIERGNKPGLFSLYATGVAWGGIGTGFSSFLGLCCIVHFRRVVSLFKNNCKHTKK